MEYLALAGGLFLVIAAIMGKEYIGYRKYLKECLKQLYEGYGKPSSRSYKEGELEHIRVYYQKHPEENQIDDITWNDLDMDRIYKKINTSCSAAGDEYLYFRMRTPMYDVEEMEAFERRIVYFMEHEKSRGEVMKELYLLGRSGKYSIYEYLENLNILGERNNRKYIFYDVLLFACVGAMFFSVPLGIVLLVAAICHNNIDYFKEYKEVEPYVTSFHYIRRVLDCVEKVEKIPLGELTEEQSRLKECRGRLQGFIRNSFLVITAVKGAGDPLNMVLDFLRMFFYLDLIQFNRMLKSVRDHTDEIDEMVTLLGKIEAAIVIGSYRNSMHNGYCVPYIYGRDETASIMLEELYHPLLEQPVANSISVTKGVLLTGSNASGKSTFLRSVGVGVLLAQTIHTCPAKHYEAPVFRIYSSMALKDDIVSGDSYYMVEIKSIKRILGQVKRARAEGSNVICFVDEVLRGTNTVERIAASTQILKMLMGNNVLCFAATHDIELTSLLAGRYENFHFEEKMEKNDIFFPYKLMEGPAVSRNAIALLRILGYDEKIVTDAETMAKIFLETGKWETLL